MKHVLGTLHAGAVLTALLLIAMSSIAFARHTQNDLEGKVLSQVGAYYTEDMNIRADQSGIVTVTGEVGTLFDKLRIGELISKVDGVRGIVNNLTVQNNISSDGQIEANIEQELAINNAILEPEKIHVEVKHGVAYLSGVVSFYREKVIAQSIASWQDGVSDMVSTIQVLPPSAARSDENLQHLINDILAHSYPLEKHLTFTVDHGEVQLHGTVRNLWAKDHIQDDVAHLLGVTKVVNMLEVQRYVE